VDLSFQLYIISTQTGVQSKKTMNLYSKWAQIDPRGLADTFSCINYRHLKRENRLFLQSVSIFYTSAEERSAFHINELGDMVDLVYVGLS
jgi:hypothetical protein